MRMPEASYSNATRCQKNLCLARRGLSAVVDEMRHVSVLESGSGCESTPEKVQALNSHPRE